MNEKAIYQPEFIPFYIKEVNDLGLTPIEGLVYGFIRFYSKNNDFYFSSKDFSKIIGCAERTINNIVVKLTKLGVIKTNTKRFNKNGVIASTRQITFCYHQSMLLSSTNDNTISSTNDIKENIKDIKKINKKTNLEEYKKDIEVNELLEYKTNKVMHILIKIISECNIKMSIDNKKAIEIYEYIISKGNEYLKDDQGRLKTKELEKIIDKFYTYYSGNKKEIKNIKSSILNFLT